MSRVTRIEDLPAALAEGRRIAEAAFGDGTVYLERLLEAARHVEFQVFGDAAGNHVSPLRTRVQRPAETPEDRGGDAEPGAERAPASGDGRGGGRRGEGRRLCRRRDGRVPRRRKRKPLLLSGDEHPAAGRAPDHRGDPGLRSRAGPARGGRGRRACRRSWTDGSLRPRGHAIELRLYAEDPVKFLPALGTPSRVPGAGGPGRPRRRRASRRDRSSASSTTRFSPSSSSPRQTREAAIARAKRALSRTGSSSGVETNARLLAAVLASDGVRIRALLDGPGRAASAPRRRWSRGCRTRRGSPPRSLRRRGSRGRRADRERKRADPWSAYPSWRPGG